MPKDSSHRLRERLATAWQPPVNKFLSYAQTLVLFDNRKLKVSDKLRKLILFKATLDGFKLTRINGLITQKHNTSDF